LALYTEQYIETGSFRCY